MKNNPKELVNELLKGSVRALARVISLIEDRSPHAPECLDLLFSKTGKAHVIGVTGPAGAGKSTLVDGVVEEIRKSGKRVSVLAVDPTSPFSGGALLGDRIRMDRAAADADVFIRSMATRGALGGLSSGCYEAIFALDAAGFDYIVIETVGVGQSEVDIVKVADTVLVTLVPGMGDEVQALKAGVLEIADIFVVNKADYDGSDRLIKELKTLLSLASHADYLPPVLKTVATRLEGIKEVVNKIEEHQAWAKSSGAFYARREKLFEVSMMQILSELQMQSLMSNESSKTHVTKLLSQVSKREKSPYTAAKELLGLKK